MDNVPNGSSDTEPILIYDGECKFCDGVVDFIFEHEKAPLIKFMWIQDERVAQIMDQHGIDPEIDSLILLENGEAYTYSSAALRVSTYLATPWNWAKALLVIPSGIRDGVYRWVAARRKKIMGSTQCALPIGKEDRFL